MNDNNELATAMTIGETLAIGPSLIEITSNIAVALIAAGRVNTADISTTLRDVYGTLNTLSTPAETAPAAPDVEKRQGKVSERASVKPGHLISMIDGKPYKMLRRHIAQHGFSPETYRTTFGLKADYPMVASDYAEQRRQLAHKIGLGKKAPATATEDGAPAARSRKK